MWGSIGRRNGLKGNIYYIILGSDFDARPPEGPYITYTYRVAGAVHMHAYRVAGAVHIRVYRVANYNGMKRSSD